jgi:ABC-2 type transport system permease protein
VIGLLRAELRKTGSTRLWWGLLIPVVLLSAVTNAFGGLFTAALPSDAGLPLLLGSLAYTLSFTAVFSAVHGIVAAAGEFRHRTVTSTYLITPLRGRVLVAKMVTSAAVGAGYAAAAVLVGLLSGAAAQEGAGLPGPGPVLAVTLIGVAVAALWGALGAALGTLVSNQVSALVGVLLYLLIGELLLAPMFGAADAESLQAVPGYLPGNAGDAAIYDIPAHELTGPELGPVVVQTATGVPGPPPPWWGGLLALAGWTGLIGALGWLRGARRDVT